jgi:hypothetical protein
MPPMVGAVTALTIVQISVILHTIAATVGEQPRPIGNSIVCIRTTLELVRHQKKYEDGFSDGFAAAIEDLAKYRLGASPSNSSRQ